MDRAESRAHRGRMLPLQRWGQVYFCSRYSHDAATMQI